MRGSPLPYDEGKLEKSDRSGTEDGEFSSDDDDEEQPSTGRVTQLWNDRRRQQVRSNSSINGFLQWSYLE